MQSAGKAILPWIFLSCALICFALRTSASELVESGDPQGQLPTDSATHDLIKKILTCPALKIAKNRQREFLAAFSRSFDKIEHCGTDAPSKNEVMHLFAMIMEETGNLNTLSESKSPYASSQSACKGRGPIQVTTKGNYENCAKFMRGDIGPKKSSGKCELGVPSQVAEAVSNCDKDNGKGAEAAIGQTGVGAASDNADVPDAQMKSAYYSALCSVSWWENAKKLKKFESLINGGAGACSAVGRTCNSGSPSGPAVPGVISKSTEAFEKISSCVGQ